MNTKKLITTAIITAFALVAFVIESAIPPIVPIYGIKLGVANIFTLFTLYTLGTKYSAAVLFIRITLGSLLTGQIMSFIYSLSGGLLSFILMILLKRFFSSDNLWVLSVLCAIAHNIGQLTTAVIITMTPQIFFYLPVLIVSGITAGAITGVTAQLVIKRLSFN
ncbi:MAG: Gx transporter family protein [Acutalibacteraceae bacterium]